MTVNRPLMRYFGGKWRIAPWIITHFPEHGCYCEPFCGGASVLLRKRPAQHEVINDLDGEVVNLFRVLRDSPAELQHLLELTPYSRAEMIASYQLAEDPVERARRYMVRAWQARGGPRPQRLSGWRFCRSDSSRASAVGSWLGAIKIDPIVKRLRQVMIEQDDAAIVLQRFDSPRTLHYVDPPYLAETRNKRWAEKGYEHEFCGESDHEALAEVLVNLKGYVVLSGYPSGLYARLFEERGWTSRTRLALTDHGTKVEAVWINPRCAAASGYQMTLEAV